MMIEWQHKRNLVETTKLTRPILIVFPALTGGSAQVYTDAACGKWVSFPTIGQQLAQMFPVNSRFFIL